MGGRQSEKGQGGIRRVEREWEGDRVKREREEDRVKKKNEGNIMKREEIGISSETGQRLCRRKRQEDG